MSRSHEVRTLSCPPSWSAWPLLVAGTSTRIRVPVIMPRMGDTWWAKEHEVRTPGPRLVMTLPHQQHPGHARPSQSPGPLLWVGIHSAFPMGPLGSVPGAEDWKGLMGSAGSRLSRGKEPGKIDRQKGGGGWTEGAGPKR